MRITRLLLLLVTLPALIVAQPTKEHNLQFDSLATSWDEGIPLGNATLGALVWQKDGELRLSLDRSDLWDLRPMKGLDGPEFSYKWIYDHVIAKDYAVVQQHLDAPYETEPAPGKLPGAALQIDTKAWGPAQFVQLNIATAIATVRWKNGATLRTYVHATKPVGWFRITNVPAHFNLKLLPPAYQSSTRSGAGSVEGDDLNRLGYKQGTVDKRGQTLVYNQQGWGGFTYQVSISYRKTNANVIEGVWSISSQYPAKPASTNAEQVVKDALAGSFNKDFQDHLMWWKIFWLKSSLHVPDAQLETQWYLEQYKFGCTARKDAPPISLQAVWTADNGRLPPWKGDFHHDLNTELSYWPSYSGNHLEEAMGYLNHLDSNKANYLRFTKKFFDTEGLNVPGVTTLNGTEMGGWIQYSGSPTTSAWLAHHYYLHWRYSMDRQFLETRAYPWISETAKFLENITSKGSDGFRKLPISSSPEIFNNSLNAWFLENTNYDLALMKFVFGAAKEMALELGKKEEAEHWSAILAEFSDYAMTDNSELMFAPGKPYDESHRHFSNLMAIHPLGLIKWEDGERSQKIITNSIKALDDVGPANWCGYSYSWLANLKARAKDGEGAAKALHIFSSAFCLKNSFHANGDQTKSGYSNFTYRPFTLEGNFAYASGLQEMLLQSYAGFIDVFPAVPDAWKDVSFTTLRAEGAFLVSAKKENGKVTEVTVEAEKGGSTSLRLPFEKWKVTKGNNVSETHDRAGFIDLSFGGKGYILLSAVE